MNEDQILSEYMDQELPPDLHRRVELRLASDPAFRARYEDFQAVRKSLRAAQVGQVLMADMQAHVWQKVQRHLGGRPKGWLSIWHGLSDALHRRIALPLPAMAAMLVVFLAISIIAISRAGTNETTATVALSNQSNQTNQSLNTVAELNPGESGIPSSLGVMPYASRNVSVAGFHGDFSNGEIPADQKMQITIQVQNLRQLMQILRNNQEIDQVTIQMPHYKNLRNLGEFSNTQTQEIGVNSAMPSQLRVGSQY